LSQTADCAVVGAGPAGLTAAIYLARYCRKVIVVHDALSRALKAPMAHNVPGFPEGVQGRALVASMLEQASRHGAVIQNTEVRTVRKEAGVFALDTAAGPIRARALVLATGVEHCEVDLPRDLHDQAVIDGVLRYCPICDGFEARNKRVAVLGAHKGGAAEALFLRQYTGDVTLIPQNGSDLTAAQVRELTAAGVVVVERPLEALQPQEDCIQVVLTGKLMTFDVLYPALGCQPRSQLAEALQVKVNDAGCIPAGQRMTTTQPGVFVAGDVVEALDQISVAAGQGAIAATSAHNWLREKDRETLSG
jgi:thioredoxin reductase (NADPH)